MFSLGIEYERAFSIAFCSARFASGSGPPSFAATMIARESFEKSCPRFASAAPFLCLMLDHLLCPDTARLLDQLQEELVNAQIVGQLGMERGEQEPSVAYEHRFAVERTENLHRRAGVTNARRPDEYAAERDLVLGEIDVGLEAAHLPTEGVAVDDQVGDVPMLAVEHDHPGAGAEDRSRVAANRPVEAVQLGEPYDRRRLAARYHEPVETVELVRQPHLDDVRAELAQRGGVVPKCSLEGEDADAQRPLHRRRYQPRTSSRSSSASELDEIPTIGSPSPAETSASTFGSSKCVVASTIAFARVSGSPDLKMPEPTKTPSAPSCMQSDASAGVAMPPAVNVTTGRRPFSATQRTSSYGARCSFTAAKSSSSRIACSPRIAPNTARMCVTAFTMSPVPASPFVRIIAAPSETLRSASPRFVAPHTKGTVNAHLSTWCWRSAGVSTSDSSM